MSKSGKAIGLPIVNTRAAGIDIGSRIQVAAVPPELSDDPVRTFGSFTADIEQMANWLTSVGITTVAMESTGVYWIPVYEILEEHGLTVLLANARDCKAVPGRKSDVNDAQWLQRLHACGLLRASFHPAREIAALRAYMRNQQVENSLRLLNADRPELENPLPAPRTKTKQANAPKFDVRSMLCQLTGTDLTLIHGIGPSIALSLISECGTDLSKWPTEKHFASWLCLSPGCKISGGKVLSSRTRKSSSRLASQLRLAACNVGRTETALGAFYRRLAARIGKAKAVTATARKLAILFYRTMRFGMQYQDPGVDQYEQRYRERVVKQLQRRAAHFGFSLQPTEVGVS